MSTPGSCPVLSGVTTALVSHVPWEVMHGKAETQLALAPSLLAPPQVQRDPRETSMSSGWWPHLCLALPKGFGAVSHMLPTALESVCAGQKDDASW